MAPKKRPAAASTEPPAPEEPPVKKRPAAKKPTGTRFAGKRVLVTGAAMGIGRGIAQGFAEEGATVFVVDIEKPPPEDEKANVVFVRCDCGKASDIEKTCKTAGHIDILVNNVAVQPEGACHEHPLENWERAIAVNLTSFFLFSKHLIPKMLKQKSGIIINIGSVQGQQSQPAIPGYAASKGGVLSLTRQLAMEYGPKGIRVNAISPGTIATPLVTGILERRGSSKEKAGKVYPMKRIGEISEVVKVALFLASDDASFMTAENVNVDGGIMGLGCWADVA